MILNTKCMAHLQGSRTQPLLPVRHSSGLLRCPFRDSRIDLDSPAVVVDVESTPDALRHSSDPRSFMLSCVVFLFCSFPDFPTRPTPDRQTVQSNRCQRTLQPGVAASFTPFRNFILCVSFPFQSFHLSAQVVSLGSLGAGETRRQFLGEVERHESIDRRLH